MGALLSPAGIGCMMYWTLFFYFMIPPHPIPILHAFGWTTLIFGFAVGMMTKLPAPLFWLIAIICAVLYIPTMY